MARHRGADRQDMWRSTVGACMIGAFVLILLGIAYLLFGPGFSIAVPRFFGLNESTAEKSFSLDGYDGAMFSCAEGRALKAEFLGSSVRLVLSDGRQLTLPPTLSGSGARYANANESFVFWNKDNMAFVEENGSQTYHDCAREG